VMAKKKLVQKSAQPTVTKILNIWFTYIPTLNEFHWNFKFKLTKNNYYYFKKNEFLF
jgi:hypothetical protein